MARRQPVRRNGEKPYIYYHYYYLPEAHGSTVGGLPVCGRELGRDQVCLVLRPGSFGVDEGVPARHSVVGEAGVVTDGAGVGVLGATTLQEEDEQR